MATSGIAATYGLNVKCQDTNRILEVKMIELYYKVYLFFAATTFTEAASSSAVAIFPAEFQPVWLLKFLSN